MNPHLKPPISPAVLAHFAAIVGERYAITDPDAQAPYILEMRDIFQGRTPMVLRPNSVEQIAAIMTLADETNTPIVPQGGNTGLVGGQVPNGEIVLSLNRLDRIREIDPTSNTMTCEAGVTLMKAREAAEAVDRLYPLLLPSEGSCTVGGNLSTNAGGTTALAYGVARSQVLGVEVVLADGRVLNNLNKLKKDNTGYDLKNLFVGSEGTLGIITAAVLKLLPRPRSVETAFVGLASPDAALELLGIAQERTGGAVTSFEILPRLAIDYVIQYAVGCRDPLGDAHPWYVLVELSSQQRAGLRATLEDLLGQGLERGLIADAAIADSLDQSKAFWRVRENMAEALRALGGVVTHDVSVPVASVPAFIADANAAMDALIPACRPVPFGHLGDGNIHYNVTQPANWEREQFLARRSDITERVHESVTKFNGSISAEHGIGVLKREYLPAVKDPVALDLMRTLKRTLDPKNILNPGKVL